MQFRDTILKNLMNRKLPTVVCFLQIYIHDSLINL